MPELLAELGMSQATFAKLVGISPNTAGRWAKRPPVLAMRYLRLLVACRRLGLGDEQR